MRTRFGLGPLLCCLTAMITLAGCPKDNQPPTPKAEGEAAPAAANNPNPYKNVMPKKIGAEVDAIKKAEDERNDKRLEEAK